MLKKLTLVLVMISAVVLVINAAEKFAVLVTGDYAAREIPDDFLWQSNNSDDPDKIVNPMPEFWYDTYLMWEMLIKKGYKDENIYVLFADGTDFNKTDLGYYVDKRYTPQNIIDDPSFTITDRSATRANLELVTEELNGKMHEDDFLFVWTFDHGGTAGYYPPTPWISSIILMPAEGSASDFDDMSDSDFALLFNPIKANKKVFWIQQCYGGGFWDDLTYNTEAEQNYDNVYFHSAVEMTPASVADDRTKSMDYIDYLESELIGDEIYTHGEFNYHMYSVSMGCTPNPIYTDNYNGELFINADLNNDGIISMSETSTWEIAHESLDKLESPPPPPDGDDDASKFDYSYDQVPLVSDLGYIGDHTTLEYPTIIKSDYYAYSSFLKGIMAISGNLSINRVNLTLPINSYTTALKNSIVDIYTGYNFTVQKNATLKLSDGSELRPVTGGILSFGAYSNLIIEGSGCIKGNFQTADGLTIDILDNSSLVLQGTQLKILPGITLKLGKNAKLVVENGTVLTFDDGATVELCEGAEIVVKDKGRLITNNLTTAKVLFTSNTGNWTGMVFETGSSIRLDDASFLNAETAISGTPYAISVTGCDFSNCTNGINLINSNNYTIERNQFTGNDVGIGLRLTSSNGNIKNNIIEDYAHGVVIILCSPYLSKNIISNNVMNGIFVTGNNSYPQLIDPLETKIVRNNVIEDNGKYIFDVRNAQIRMIYPSNAYMYNGLNNVYPNIIAPAIKTESNLIVSDQLKSEISLRVRIPAINNYWGESSINASDYEYFFNLWNLNLQEGYSISYEPYSSIAYEVGTIHTPALISTLTVEGKFLAQAIKAEFDGKIDLAIKKYNQIIDKYPNSEENLIALTRLTDILVNLEEPLDQLMAVYDANLTTGDESVNKKFYKEMKVSTSIKAKKYNEAILLAEEIKAIAKTENEVLMADIDIAIANMMKNAGNKGSTGTEVLNSLLVKLSESELKSKYDAPTEIDESAMPSDCTLYQNYPNPFNPVTQIKFALAKTADVKLSVYNIVGQLVSQLASGERQAGIHTVDFDGSRFNSGVYYYTLEVEGKSLTQKMILMK